MAKLKIVIKPGDRVTLLGPNKHPYEIWLEEVSPERAAFLLAHLGVQRRQKIKQINKLATTMSAGHWNDLNGDTFVYDEQGGLIQGQHRCQAVIKSGRPIWVFAVGNVSDDAIFDIDQDQSVRTFGDVLSMKGEKYAADIAACIQIMGRWQSDTMNSYVSTIDNRAAYQLLKRHPSLRHSVAWCATQLASAPLKLLPTSSLAWLHYILTRIDAEKGLLFVEILTWTSDKRPTKECPAHVLRDRLEKAKKALRRDVRLSAIEKLAWTIKGWNLYVQESHVSGSISLRWPPGQEWPSIRDAEGDAYSYGQLRKLPANER